MPENTRSSERKQQNLKEWERYLTILEMRADERSMPYIAKKLGFKHASSIANILNRFDGLEALIASKVEEARIDELKLIELAQQDEDKWSNFCMDDTSDFGNYISSR